MANLIRLRDMNPTRALAYCANLTSRIWSKLESGDVLDLWTVYRSYIISGFQYIDVPIPDRIARVWDKCKFIIDKEAKL